MPLSRDDLNELATYTEWFVLDRDRFPGNWSELAEYLDEERNNGRFADANAVRSIFALSHAATHQEMFDQFEEHYRGLVKIGEVLPASGWMQSTEDQSLPTSWEAAMPFHTCIRALKELLHEERHYAESMLNGHGAALKAAIEHLVKVTKGAAA